MGRKEEIDRAEGGKKKKGLRRQMAGRKGMKREATSCAWGGKLQEQGQATYSSLCLPRKKREKGNGQARITGERKADLSRKKRRSGPSSRRGKRKKKEEGVLYFWEGELTFAAKQREGGRGNASIFGKEEKGGEKGAHLSFSCEGEEADD